LFDVRPAVAYLNDIRLDIYTGGEKQFEGENPARGTAVHFWLKAASDATVRIADASGRVMCEQSVKGKTGMNRVQWTLTAAPVVAAGAPAGDRSCTGAAGGRGGAAAGAAPGSYTVTLTVGGTSQVKTVQVLEDRWMNER
jgi:hypothetical protein